MATLVALFFLTLAARSAGLVDDGAASLIMAAPIVLAIACGILLSVLRRRLAARHASTVAVRGTVNSR